MALKFPQATRKTLRKAGEPAMARFQTRNGILAIHQDSDVEPCTTMAPWNQHFFASPFHLESNIRPRNSLDCDRETNKFRGTMVCGDLHPCCCEMTLIMRMILVVAFVILQECSPRLACAELLLSDTAGTWTTEVKRGLLRDPLDVLRPLGLTETLGRLPGRSPASGQPLDPTSPLASAPSQLDFRVDRGEFAAGIVDLDLPVDAALSVVDVG
jgi:hypothetical protein